jgi:hypothetical protein
MLGAIGLAAPTARAQQPDFNSYMLASYKMLKADSSRALQGYNLGSFFTRNLKWGNEREEITGKNSPLTMCNAAVTETFIEAVNLYAKDNRSWSPNSAIPASLWNKSGFSGLKAHFFSHSIYEYPPLYWEKDDPRNVPVREIPQSLRDDIEKLHSHNAIAVALEKFRIGERVSFANARPGDVVTFDRTRGSGHSVTFVGFLDRNQNLVDTYDQSKVVGFKYFSSQGDKEKGQGGLSERWAYFGGFCPVRTGDASWCADRRDTSANRARFPAERANQQTDCCLNPPDSRYGTRVGRIWHPSRWQFAAAQAEIAKQDEAVRARIKEFVRNRQLAAARLALIAKGAAATNTPAARRFVAEVQTKLSIDLPAISREAATANASPQTVNRLTRLAPRAVIDAANRQVTTASRDALQSQVERVTADAMANFDTAEVASAKFDGIVD